MSKKYAPMMCFLYTYKPVQVILAPLLRYWYSRWQCVHAPGLRAGTAAPDCAISLTNTLLSHVHTHSHAHSHFASCADPFRYSITRRPFYLIYCTKYSSTLNYWSLVKLVDRWHSRIISWNSSNGKYIINVQKCGDDIASETMCQEYLKCM